MGAVYIIKFTNRAGETVVREFEDGNKAASYVAALKDQGLEYTVTKDLAASFTNWAEGVVNG